ncbi:leukosialin-like isoform X1 [Coregonus clupeaformis]|uniref:leukosialin-like isoform X1 n=2 Tax=Coregonus clupeaformis TaxID=59861 RepID=UPI001E1C49CB|nr:leukosialin-like isoform X1 [Coregonus clupeaformis]
MERIRLMLGALLLSLSLPSLPAQDNVTITVPENVTMAAPTTEDVTIAASTPEATIGTTPVPVVVTTAQPATEIITPVTSVPVPTADAITMVITDPETTTGQVGPPTSTSEAETMTPSPVTTEGPVDTTTPPGPKPTLSQDVLMTTSYFPTTSQDHLTSVIQVWPLHTTPRLTEDSSPTPEPIHTASESTANHTEGLTTAPTSPSVNAAPSHAMTPTTTHTSTSTDPDSTVAEVGVQLGQSILLFIALLVGVICMGIVYCVCLIVRRKRQSRTEYFESSFRNGKGSKRKKGAEEDAWAGPVKLGGGDREEGEGGEEGGSPEDNKTEGAGTDVVLSTFIANETEEEKGGPDGGVGVAGSKEAEKWEEEEPLLYIDEGVEERLERMAAPSLSKSNSEKKRGERNGEGESEKEMERGEGNGQKENEPERGEQNGGAAFCLTTAV